MEPVFRNLCKGLVALIVVPLTLIFAPIAKYNSSPQNCTTGEKSINLDRAIAWVLARILTLLPNYLSLLKKLEVGVFFFCWRSHREAKAMPPHQARLYGGLADNLKEQAISEYAHAQVFCQLTGSKLNMSGAGLMSREEKAAFDWGCVNWDSSESYQADGMSTRYLSAKVFFGFRTANSYDWCDRLAFMYVLEEFQFLFYKQLLKFVPEEVQLELNRIAEDEESHAISIHGSLWCLVGPSRQEWLTFLWQVRKYLALACFPFDAICYMIKHKFYYQMTDDLKLVRVRYLQPESREGIEEFKLDGWLDHPARYVYCVCWLYKDSTIQLVGGSGRFPVSENKCASFLGFPAEIIEELDESHFKDPDYYEPVATL